MPLKGSQLDELLSGFLDGELNGEELQQIRTLLDEQPEVKARLDELSALSSDLKAAFGVNTPSPLAGDFASRVVAEAQRQAAASKVAVAGPRKRPWNQLAAAAAALAAVLMLAVFGPRFFSTTPEPVNLADTTPAESASESSVSELPSSELASSAEASPFLVPPQIADSSPNEESQGERRFVSNMEFKNTIVLVVDLVMSTDAQQRDALNVLLGKHGLLTSKPVEVNDEIKEAVSETRMIVQPEGFDSADASIYFLRASVEVLGAALDEVYLNSEDFPKVAFDIAVDNPHARLLETIARASGTRFAMDEAFAVPVTIGSDAPVPFKVRGSVRYVSSEQRSQGFGGNATMLGGDGLNTVLLLVRKQY